MWSYYIPVSLLKFLNVLPFCLTIKETLQIRKLNNKFKAIIQFTVLGNDRIKFQGCFKISNLARNKKFFALKFNVLLLTFKFCFYNQT